MQISKERVDQIEREKNEEEQKSKQDREDALLKRILGIRDVGDVKELLVDLISNGVIVP